MGSLNVLSNELGLHHEDSYTAILYANTTDGHNKYYMIIRWPGDSQYLGVWGSIEQLYRNSCGGSKYYDGYSKPSYKMAREKERKGYELKDEWDREDSREIFTDAVSWAVNGTLPSTQASKSPIAEPGEYSQETSPWWNGGPIKRLVEA